MLELSRDPANLTPPSLPTEIDQFPIEPTSLAVGDGFVPPKPEFGESDVSFPSPKSDQPDSTDPQNFRQYLVDLVRSRPFSSSSQRDFVGSSRDLAKNGLD